MPKIIILGANGGIARIATDMFHKTTDAHLTLFLRNAKRLKAAESSRLRVVEGDVLDTPALAEAMSGQDVAYANLDGSLEAQARSVVSAMHTAGVRRLIWISSMGIYNEAPGEQFGSVLDPYRKSAEAIEASDLEYTILRPGWFTDEDMVDYQLTQKGQPFQGHDVSRKSVAALVVKLAMTPSLEVRRSLGVSKRWAS